MRCMVMTFMVIMLCVVIMVMILMIIMPRVIIMTSVIVMACMIVVVIMTIVVVMTIMPRVGAVIMFVPQSAFPNGKMRCVVGGLHGDELCIRCESR